jgi:fibro-slime domain-containing protein
LFGDSGPKAPADGGQLEQGSDASLFGPLGEDGSTPTGDGSPACAGDACTDAPDALLQVCGDGVVQGTEQCDDGNSTPGDGCDGLCHIEPGYMCPTAGQPCVSTIVQVCGNGQIEGSEACDDGNTVSNDGCSSMCVVETGWSCAVPGQPCTQTMTNPVCGNGKVEAGEQCDDGNSSSNDGCSATCQIETGWTCPTPGMACQPLQYCGDGIVQPSLNETCDDGNAVPGDGCSGVCTIEPGYACPDPGLACVKIWVCGNGHIDPGEACDDGNTVPNDGCSADCSTVEPGYTCPKANGNGGPCVKAPVNTCGDGIVAGNEECDDGNTTSNDGCSSTCAVEPGFTCPTAGQACKRIEYCGDGAVNLDLGETCDDGNTVSGDGCSSLCQLEANFVCPTPGAPCVSTVKCGDGKVSGSETCDDGNTVSNDGCSSSCQVEVGWQCPTAGVRCIAKQCGDGIIAGNEQCDDGNTNANDGCSPTCTLEPGFACTVQMSTPESKCHATRCGDGVKEGFEQCDDGNLKPYDGCSPTCTIEPHCSGGTCTAVCGDGLKFPQEGCDDGNKAAGDGCSSTCTVETGWTCPTVDQPPAASLVIPILYRDMLYYNTTPPPGPGHPDFNNPAYFNNGARTGLVQATLGSDGEPLWASNVGTGTSALLTNARDYCWWYHDSGCTSVALTAGTVPAPNAADPNTFAKDVWLDAAGNPTTLTLAQQGAGSNVYQFSDQTFYPLDGLGWNAGANPQTDIDCSDNVAHNFSFTSELHYPFTYVASAPVATFDFIGDDDVWAFINGHLIADLGGIHRALEQTVQLTAAEASTLGLVDGAMYSIDLFQAERHVCLSTYKLTLSGFLHTVSQCSPICGDGKVVGNEQCDEGPLNGSGYGHCTANCTLGPRCGDGIVQSPNEQCDDGVNATTYGDRNAKACGPGCQYAPYCGDGIVSNGEQCDEGAANGSGYGHCTASCTLGPRCGNGIIDGATEQCDDGINNGATGDKCTSTCVLRCGDGVVEPPEQCDLGLSANKGGYNGCNPDCTQGPRCGDGVKNGSEQCDDGKNDGSYGTCNPNCTLAGYCGDGALQDPPETCDQGAANSVNAYGPNMCTNRCTPAPYCGDKQVEGQFGETCDDGVNNGQSGHCTTDCKSFVPLPSCGNGVLDPGEQCDDGTNNGTAIDKCDTHCRFKCGNGIKDPGEQCDNGVNDGSYGTCNPNCTLAGYCGDGIKNGSEQCDDGTSNVSVATAYGPGICTTACTFAPYCGDGRVQTQFGEACDSTASCNAKCQVVLPK